GDTIISSYIAERLKKSLDYRDIGVSLILKY
ncbi:MAG: hypothetical protein ACJARX_002301, partial [Psychroserpens sp.]